MLRLLLARDGVNPDKLDNYGRTALWWASYLGNEGVVRLLLARDDVNPNRSDNDGTTALFSAIIGGGVPGCGAPPAPNTPKFLPFHILDPRSLPERKLTAGDRPVFCWKIYNTEYMLFYVFSDGSHAEVTRTSFFELALGGCSTPRTSISLSFSS